MPTIAIIGASNDRAKYGNKALRAFRNQGYTVVPINPREETVEGETRVPQSASVMSSTRRTETPARYISISASSTEASRRR